MYFSARELFTLFKHFLLLSFSLLHIRLFSDWSFVPDNTQNKQGKFISAGILDPLLFADQRKLSIPMTSNEHNTMYPMFPTLWASVALTHSQLPPTLIPWLAFFLPHYFFRSNVTTDLSPQT